jgi:16S rRNA (cytosine967-C5)-methyltransferase
MMYGNHLRYAAGIIKEYDGNVPLAVWLKDFFKENKQMGSRDRKMVAELVYGYYRLGHLHYENVEERLLAGYHKTPVPGQIFPWSDALSRDIDAEAFSNSFLIQPDLFLRIRPGKEGIVYDKLKNAGIPYYSCENNCIGMPNSTKIDQLLNIDVEVVVQDRSSQRTGSLLPQMPDMRIWDCCAASGGKSIMAHDLLANIDLTVSDIRPPIINNLKERFTRAGISPYKSFVADLTSDKSVLPEEKYDLIIADVPCSGSGTWSRTPEQMFFFKEEKIGYYSALQKKISARVVSSINRGGYLLYITCSVFAEENEEVVKYILDNHPLSLVEARLLKGYTEKADTLFAALFNAQTF